MHVSSLRQASYTCGVRDLWMHLKRLTNACKETYECMLLSDPSSILKTPFEETFSMHQFSLLTHQRQAQCQHPVHAQDVVGNNIPKMTEANNIPKMTEVDMGWRVEEKCLNKQNSEAQKSKRIFLKQQDAKRWEAFAFATN